MLDPDRRWLRRGVCASGDGDPDTWFPAPSDRKAVQRAIRLCQTCPVQRECQRDTLGEPDGIWGGLEPEERRERRKALTQEAKGWSREERLAWGRACHNLYKARSLWAYVQERTGLTTYLARTLAEEYEATLERPQKAPPKAPDGPMWARPDFPSRAGTRHAWIRRDGFVADSFYRGQTEDGQWFRVATSLSKGAHSNVWVPAEDIHIYQPQSVVILERPRVKRRYTGKRAA